MKEILVTGGAGFLGSHLCERLLADGNRVECWDNLFTGSLKNIQPLMRNKQFQFTKRDISQEFISCQDFDEIYNLACPAAPGHYQYDPIQTMKTCVLGALNVLSIAEVSDAKILQASTSEIYGEPLSHPQVETDWTHVNPVGTRACYDCGKIAVETLFMDYRRQHGTKVKIARIFNTYGPGMHPYDGRVVSNFIRQALTGEPITIYGDGDQTRSFCYRDDLVEGLIRLMGCDYVGPVNLGNPTEFTIADLAYKVLLLTDSTSKMKWKPGPADDPTRRKPSIDLAETLLDWHPSTHLIAGLIKTIDWFKSINFTEYTPPTPRY